MAKKILGYIKLQVPAGSATPSPPIGPALGQRGVNIMGFVKEFNARTEKEVEEYRKAAPEDVRKPARHCSRSRRREVGKVRPTNALEVERGRARQHEHGSTQTHSWDRRPQSRP
jgi:hypothetical protein